MVMRESRLRVRADPSKVGPSCEALWTVGAAVSGSGALMGIEWAFWDEGFQGERTGKSVLRSGGEIGEWQGHLLD